MRILVAILLMLATPLCAQAKDHWRDGRGAPPAVYQGPPRGERPGGGRPDYGGPPMQREMRPPSAMGWGDNPPPRTQQQRARDDVRAGRRVPLPMVIERLRRQTGGEYIDAREMRDPYGRPVYMLRFRQPGGRFVDVPVSAETGEIQR